jgi:phosphoheptose isomerase
MTVDVYQHIAGIFQSHIEHSSLEVDAIAEVAGATAELATAAVIGERKLMSVGIGPDAGAAITLVELLRGGLAAERPALPVIELVARQSETLAASHWLASQLRALCQPGDVVLLFASQLDVGARELLATAVHQREADCVWLGCQGPAGLGIDYPGAPPATQLLLNQAIALAIADLIDRFTFGDLED